MADSKRMSDVFGRDSVRKATKCRTDVVREWEGRKHRSQFIDDCKYVITLLDYEDSQS